MRRGRIFIFIALILLIALGGVFFFLKSRSTPSQEVVQGPALVDIVVAEQNIPQGAEITDDVLGKISLPEGTDFGVMFRYEQREELVVGKVARYPIQQGVVITQPMIGAAGDIATTGPDWATMNLIPSGMTAISLPVTRLSSVSYGVADGAHVNVIACINFVDVDSAFQSKLPNYTASVSGAGYPVDAPSLAAIVGAAGSPQGRVELDATLQQPMYVVPSEAQRPRPVCQTILQNAVVLRLGEFPVEDVDNAEAPSNADETAATPPDNGADAQQASNKPDVVTLVVSPQDATSLTYLLYSGANLNLTLRGTDDASRVETEAATLQFLLSQYAIPVPAKLPYAFEPRMDQLSAPVPDGATQ